MAFDPISYIIGKSKGMSGGITILHGSADPTAVQGSNGQIYLKIGGNLGPDVSADPEYVCTEAGVKLALIDYRNYYKTYADPAIVVICRYDSYWQPHLASLTADGVVYSADSGGPFGYTHTYVIDGRTWYFNKGDHGIPEKRITTQFPVVDESYKFETQNNAEQFLSLANILEGSACVLGGYAKVDGAWQNLIGTDIKDINLGN